jgi:hypothetical protein
VNDFADQSSADLAGFEDVLRLGAVWAEVPADLERRVLDSLEPLAEPG